MGSAASSVSRIVSSWQWYERTRVGGHERLPAFCDKLSALGRSWEANGSQTGPPKGAIQLLPVAMNCQWQGECMECCLTINAAVLCPARWGCAR